MTERSRRIEELFTSALELDPGERGAFLYQACGDDRSLREEIESLIASDARAGDFIEANIFELVARTIASDQSISAVGRWIGPYRIVREIGRGGMGAVYFAERADDQFHKEVAIKLVKRGMDTDFVLNRFLHERQILADMDHPNIARLYDGGATEDGLPYFVMEYIDGLPIDEYCDTHSLSITERLKLFRKVCSAVVYAHQRMIVHCDIKPSNILITPDGVPKLLDFGIAKLLDTDITSPAAGRTATVARLMTPDYASPEQARGLAITTASDTYSLGVLLYGLMTGHMPYRIDGRTSEEIARVICEQEPERPSAVISRESKVTGAAPSTPETVSRKREGQSDKLRRRLRGDLDNIVLKAMRKEPPRRYISVDQFSEDIRRHLDGLPIIARKDTFSYRTAKFIGRNKIAVTAAALLLIVLLVGIVVTTGQARVARAGRAEAVAQRARAEKRFDDVRKLANSLMFEFHDSIKDLTGSTPARRLLVSKAAEYLDSLAVESNNDSSLQRELATAYQQLGEIQSNIYDSGNIGDSAGALASHNKALALRETASLSSPGDTQLRKELATSYIKVAEMIMETGNAAAAVDLYSKGLAIFEQLSAADPDNKDARLALAASYHKFYIILATSNHPGAIIETLTKVISICEQLLADDPANTQAYRQMAMSSRSLGDIMWLHGNPSEAWRNYYRAKTMADEWVAKDPFNREARRSLFLGHLFIGDMMVRYGNPQGAIENFHKALSITEELSSRDPSNVQAGRDLRGSYERLADALTDSGNTVEAIKIYRAKVLPFYEALASSDPKSTRYSRDLAALYSEYSEKLKIVGNRGQALDFARKAQRMFDELLAKDPGHEVIQTRAALALCSLSELLTKAGRLSEAREYTRRALVIQKAQADTPDAFGDRINHYSWSLLTCEPENLRDPAAALPYAKLAAERTHENDPNILKTLALAYYLTGDPYLAVGTAKKALALLPPHAQSNCMLRRKLESDLAKYGMALNVRREK